MRMSSNGADGAKKVGGLATGIGVVVATGNPVPAVVAAVDFVGWVYDVWHKANRQKTGLEKPTRSVATIFDTVIERSDVVPAWSPPARSVAQASNRQIGWAATGTVGDEAAVQARAATLALSSESGSDFDNWLRAKIELQIAKRAEELARTSRASGDLDNWLQAERELLIAQRAREFAASNPHASDVENWLVAERQVLTKLCAREIAESPEAGPDLNNWLLAERRVLTIQRARVIANSPGAAGDLDNWLRAEREVRVVLRAEAIARNGAPGGDQTHWFQAEREIADIESLEMRLIAERAKRRQTKATVVTWTTGCARKRNCGLNS
jgi:hypothetical protein